MIGIGLKFLGHWEPSRLTPDLNKLWTPTTICKRIAILSIWSHHYTLFLSIPFLNSLHVSCCSSLVTLFLSSSLLFYTFVSKEIVFGQKYPFLGPQSIGFFYVAHRRKIAHLSVQTPSQLDDHIFSRYKHTYYRNTNGFEFW